MSIEKNIQTLADNRERVAAALEGILAVLQANSAPIATGGATPSGVTTSKDTSEADDKAAKAAAAKEAKAAAAKEAKAAADKEAKAAADKEAKAAKAAADKAAKEEAEKNSAGGTISYDAIKAIVVEIVGIGPDGRTAVKSVLDAYGVAKASDVPEHKWEELLQAFEKAKDDLSGQGDLA